MIKSMLRVCMAVLVMSTATAGIGLQSVSDIAGDGAAHALRPAGTLARWVLIVADPANASAVRIGGSAVSATNGTRMAAGAGLFMPPIAPDARQAVDSNTLYDMSTMYYFVASGDKISLIWGY